MNPLVKKEIRLLLPAWIAAMLMAIIPIWISPVWSRFPSGADPYVGLTFVLGLLILSIASFGQEFSLGTFSLFLSQPMERRRIWQIKTAVLTGAFVSVLLASTVSPELFYFVQGITRTPHLLTELGFTALFVAVIFSGGLWTTLLLGRVLESFWLTLLTPLAIMFVEFAFHEYLHWSNQMDNYVFPAILSFYSLAGFFWARRLFLRAQDLQWTGGEIGFHSRKRAARRTAVSNHPRHWLSALVWKELQLQQVNILIAVVVLALHLASVLIHELNPNFINPNVLSLLGLIWGLWLAMPLLIGSAAVAEERRVGVTESQFCLPISPRSQFFIKFFTGLILSLVLGGAMPFIIERVRDINGWIFVVAAATFFISIYASTLLRTTLQAIGLALGLALVIYFFEVATAVNYLAFHQYAPDKIIGLELLKLFPGVPILFLVLAGLMYGNFKWQHENWKMWRRNSIAVLTGFAAIFVLTNSIYFRVWEFPTPTRPPQGLARLHSSGDVKFAAYWNTIYATLPDGRLWVGTLARFDTAHQPGPKLDQAEFIGGSNWTAVATDGFQTLGLQSNGTLWNLQRPGNPSQDQRMPTGAFHPVQIGSDTNWSQATGGLLGFLLLQKDGTLWIWGTNGYAWQGASNNIEQKLILDLNTPPVRTGTGSKWVEVFVSSDRRGVCAINHSGDILELSTTWRRNFEYTFLQTTNTSSRWVSFASQGWADAGINTNGELWFSLNDWSNNTHIPVEKIQLGRDSKWRTVVFDDTDFWAITAIRNDGTLWRWPLPYRTQNRPLPVKPVQLGSRSDWLAFFRWWGLTYTLAADGSLWTWDEPSRYVWLAPSRKPVYLGNIFTTQ